MQDYYTQYYAHQTGRGVANVGYNEQFQQLQLPRVYQRGRGVGAIFSTIWRFLKPLLKSGASFVGREAVNTGADILQGIANQKPIKQVLADRSIQVVDKIRDKTADKIKSMSGSGALGKRKKGINSKASAKRRPFASSLRAAKKKNKKKKTNKFK